MRLPILAGNDRPATRTTSGLQEQTQHGKSRPLATGRPEHRHERHDSDKHNDDEGRRDEQARCDWAHRQIRTDRRCDAQDGAVREQARFVPRRRRCQYQAMVDVTIEARNDADNPGLVKLQAETWELNIWATTEELWKLAGIENTDWAQRRTLQVGTCANTSVWWNEQDGTVYILAGNDDETWDLCVTVPLATVHKLLAELEEPPRIAPLPSGSTPS